MTVTRIHEDPRVTKPFTEAQWSAIDTLGRAGRPRARRRRRAPHHGRRADLRLDRRHGRRGVELHRASRERKLELATDLLYRLRKRFAPGALLHFGQGKWYPGEPLPRWALSCFWRKDGVALWDDDRILTPALHGEGPHARPRSKTRAASRPSSRRRSALPPEYVLPAYEDPWRIIRDEANLPLNVDPARRGHSRPRRARGGCAIAARGRIRRARGLRAAAQGASARAKASGADEVAELALAAAPRQRVPDRGRLAHGLPPAARLAAGGAARGRGAR